MLCWLLTDWVQVYTIFKKRYQLEHVAMEVTDISGMSLHFACRSVSVSSCLFQTLSHT